MKKFIVYGLGISGLAAAKALAKHGDEVIATDDNLAGIEQAKLKLGSDETKIKFQNPDEISFDKNSVISFAPGIPLYAPTPHKILEICKKTGAELACDIEIFWRQNSRPSTGSGTSKFIGITGTNGKSTTTALTGFILKELGVDAEVGGNIGVGCFELPAYASLQRGGTALTYVFEMSSYQLDLISKTHFNIAALLNITPDHLDRHGSMNDYITAKKRIFMNQKAGDFALIDVDNENSRAVFDELKNDKNFQATLIPISTEKKYEGGVSFIKGTLQHNIAGKNFTTELKSQFLRGQHNEQNMAFAFAISYCSGLHSEEKIISTIKQFQGLRHRCQLLGEIDGIKFINDSKATNAESTENALKAYDKIFWILGGKAKDGGISSLAPYFKKITKAYLIGEATEDFAKLLEENSVTFEKCGDLKNAFELAFLDAKKSNDHEKNIMLSPACASFDQWKSFEQRGDFFCQMFEDLKSLSAKG